VSDFIHSREIGEDPRVKTAANIFKSFCYDYRDSLSAGIICAGWDKYEGGQVIMPAESCAIPNFVRLKLYSLN
jgi:putative cell wall-binding protein